MVVTWVWISPLDHFFLSSSPSLIPFFNSGHPPLKMEIWRHDNAQDSDYLFKKKQKKGGGFLITNESCLRGFWWWFQILKSTWPPTALLRRECFVWKMTWLSFASHSIGQGWSSRWPLTNIYSSWHDCIAINLHLPPSPIFLWIQSWKHSDALFSWIINLSLILFIQKKGAMGFEAAPSC